ncbi:MAG TPA: hypothetical protein VKU80_07790 [Planctomycetota bacterium]|nr:hypothetical protein [Planctomycetota bacterium]
MSEQIPNTMARHATILSDVGSVRSGGEAGSFNALSVIRGPVYAGPGSPIKRPAK